MTKISPILASGFYTYKPKEKTTYKRKKSKKDLTKPTFDDILNTELRKVDIRL